MAHISMLDVVVSRALLQKLCTWVHAQTMIRQFTKTTSRVLRQPRQPLFNGWDCRPHLHVNQKRVRGAKGTCRLRHTSVRSQDNAPHHAHCFPSRPKLTPSPHLSPTTVQSLLVSLSAFPHTNTPTASLPLQYHQDDCAITSAAFAELAS